MTLDTFVIQLTNGLVFSLLLFLIAAGLSLIFGLMDVVNLSHGAFYLLGAYVGLSITRWTGSFWLALLFSPLLVAVIGLVVERFLLRQLYRRGHLDQVLCTFGVGLILADVMRSVWGSYVESVAIPAPLDGQIVIGGLPFPVYRLAVIVFGLLIALGLWLLIERTLVGAMIRAGVNDAQMASALGINIPRLFALVFAGGTALAALGGVAASPILNIYQGLDSEILILALVVVVIGGLGTLQGAFWASLIVGMADVFGKALLPEFSVFVTYAIMAGVLLVRPQGLFRREQTRLA
ncbi:MAG: branched-chain amino acid ABC transporter permease [Roseiflexaceae bacterium]|nr:branched-chain amino acid ABC transporter permease [Roseiflexaceae bacterium]